MKVFFTVVFSLFCCMLFSSETITQKTDVLEIRKQMLLAINSAKVTDSLYTHLQTINKKPPIVVAYMGALEALKAKDSWNPYNKIKYLNLSNKTIKQAIAESPNDLEIRFIRFSIQFHLPGFLGLSKDMNADKNLIIQQIKQKHYGSADKVYLQNIIKFMVDSKQCTPQEVAFLHEQSAALK